MTNAVIELEGFQFTSDVFIIKELAFYDVYKGYHSRWLFLPPHPWKLLPTKVKSTYDWVIRNCHNLQWESGDLPYTALRSILETIFFSYSVIYVKGLEKANFLKKLSERKILNLNDFLCPKLLTLVPSAYGICPDHARDFKHCALAKAFAYGSFIKERLSSSDIIFAQDVKHRAS